MKPVITITAPMQEMLIIDFTNLQIYKFISILLFGVVLSR